MVAQCVPNQKVLNQGMPYTYIPKEELPECYDFGAERAWLKETLDYVEGTPHPDIRYVYRVYNHPELIEFGPGEGIGSMTIEVPRNPGESEFVTFTTCDSFRLATSPEIISWQGLDPETGGLGAVDYKFVDRSARETGPIPDTVYVGFVLGLPANYKINDGLPNDRRWGFFVQNKDPTFHPALSSTVDLTRRPDPEITPNPGKDLVRIETPDGWADNAGRITVRSLIGQIVFQQTVQSFNLSGTNIDITGLASGTYIVHMKLTDSSGSWATSKLVVE